jgi:hypothetical protein
MMLIRDRSDFYRETSSLETLQNNILVLLTCKPIRHMTYKVLVKWATSVNNQRLYKRLINNGYDFNLYTLVRALALGRYAQNLQRLGNSNELLSIEELEDRLSWELPVRKSFLLELEERLRKIIPGCIIKPGYNPTKPNTEEVEILGRQKARIIRKWKLHSRAKRIINKDWPKTAAFYSNLVKDGNREMDIDK